MKVRLGDIISIKTGKLNANTSSLDGKYPFFTCAIEPLKINRYSYDCECVLIAGNGDLNVKYYCGKFDAYQRTYIIESLDKQQLSVPYLYLFMSKYIDLLRNQAIGGVIKYIKLANITEAQLDIPTLSMQKKIVKTIGKLDITISKRKQQLTKLDELVKSRFMEMFGDPWNDSNKYPLERLSNLSEKITDGVHKKPTYTQSGRPFLSVVNINKRVVDFSNCKFISNNDFDLIAKSNIANKGDILYTKVGTYGIAAHVETDIKFALYVSVCLIKPKHNIINSCFLAHSMNMPYVKYQADRRVKGIGVPDLHLNQIREFSIIVPPLPLQQQFAAFVEKVDKSKLAVKQSLEKLETLKKSLMQQYFG